jgi:hypothetical protein
MKKAPTSGMNEKFGFKINEPFFIVSRLWMHRVAQTDSNNVRLVTLNKSLRQ